MFSALRSAWIWTAISLLIVVWLPLLWAISLVDKDPVRYRTGRWFRRLGVAMTKVNPTWELHVGGYQVANPRRPYVVVSNHQSLADIPLVSHLPWEMKWVGKKELFRLPIIGLMMKFSLDIPVDRKDPRSGAKMLLRCLKVLEQKCSVMFFPEGTRSPDGLLGRFNEGAFHLAIKAQVPILPVVVEGSFDCLPKKSWRFGKPAVITVKVLPPVETGGMTTKDSGTLCESVRGIIAGELAQLRGTTVEMVDRLVREGTNAERKQ
jgi:1-acyl-sn-glycerol-3-phosphate acyltransferase